MYSCDEIGKHQADEVLVRVPLRLYENFNTAANDKNVGAETVPAVDTEAVIGVLKELNETCSEHKREATRRIICRVSEQTPLSFTLLIPPHRSLRRPSFQGKIMAWQ
jgi:nuclear pore complex protein Nup85